MALSPPSKNAPNTVQDARPERVARISVYDLFKRHIHLLADLPGEVSQFDQSEHGYEWRCEYDLGGSAPGQPGVQLHFSLIDLERQPRPAAVLYLVGQARGSGGPERLMLPLEDLAETHEQLNERLSRDGATIAVLENASRFITALTRVREALGEEVNWS